MTRVMRNPVALLATALMVAACGSGGEDEGNPIYDQLRKVAAPAIARAGGKAEQPKQVTAPLTADQMAARALAANPAPLILAGMESSGATQVMAMVGENGNMRTYMTPNEQALIIRSGMLTGTKGLGGHDLSVAEVEQTAALVHARRSGQAQRTMRYLGGDGIERPLPLNCTIAVGGNKSFSFAGTAWNATQVVETCQGGGAEVQNSYLVTVSGQIPVSRQWISPQLGYVTIQTIRP